MAYVYPFIGTRYNPKVVGDLSQVVTPPYDCISPEQQTQYYDRHPRNIVRLILGKDIAGDDEFNNRYSRAANLLQEWRRDQVLMEDAKQSFYLCEQTFTTPDGRHLKRRGYFGLVRLQGYGPGKIRAHERTFTGPKADRYRLMRATQFNLCSIFVLYDDSKNELGKKLSSIMDKAKPNISVKDDETTTHSLWIASNKETLCEISEAMHDRELFIADGHHRFETALFYRNEIRRMSGQKGGRHGSDYMMMYLVSMSDPGLVILPTHRALAEETGIGVDLQEVVKDLEENFKVEPVTVDLRKNAEKAGQELLDMIAERGKKAPSMAMVTARGQAYVISLKRGVKPETLIESPDMLPAVAGLDVSLLHSYIIPNVWIGNPEIELGEEEIFYTRKATDAFKMLTTRKACVVFLMNPPKMDQVISLSKQDVRLPHKTTFFFPKVPSGLVLRDMRTIGA
ncbi:MAG: DUF1015 domain-containing protein [Candidatus Sumerlaeota bacterium]|nr:DUF1015 domain-containing protein [Candidatus Sumerlaeota bacterium]